MKISAKELKVGMGVKTWFGTHTVVELLPYNGSFDFILNVIHFSNGTKMSNETSALYEVL